MLTVHSPWFALLLVPLTGAVLYALRRRYPTVQVSTLDPFRRSGARFSWHHPTHIPMYVQAAGLVLLTGALMRPQKGIEMLVERTEGIDIILVLDVSGSMGMFDAPAHMTDDRQVVTAVNSGALKTRMETAKDELRKFVKDRPDDRIGLIAFAARPYVVCPPTLDHDFLLNHLATLEAGMFADDRTGIAAPVCSAANRLKDSPAKRRVMVLFTDGENNVEGPVSPVQAAKIAATFDATAYTVGIGSSGNTWGIARGFGGNRLVPARSGLDEELLREMAAETGGQYFAARDARGFSHVMREIDELETVDIEAPRYLDYREVFFPWLVAGLITILLGVFLENTLLVRAP